MIAFLMVVQVFVAIALIGVVLIQRSEGGGLGIGSSQGMGAFMSGRGTANLLTRATAILAAVFLGLSLAMALMNRGASSSGSGILATPPGPVTSPVPAAPFVPGSPEVPAAPVAPRQATAASAAPASKAAPTPALPPPAPATHTSPAPVPPVSPAPAPPAPASPAPAVPH